MVFVSCLPVAFVGGSLIFFNPCQHWHGLHRKWWWSI